MFGRIMTALLVFLLLGPLSALAQTERGSIVGIARDTTGGVLPGVTVTVTSAATGVEQTYVTNTQGLYEAPFLSPGTYRVSAALSGFTTAVIEEVTVNIGRRVNADVTMTPAGVATEVTVVAQQTLVQQETATVGQVFTNKTLIELPSTDGNVYNVLTLNSNVTAPAGGNAPAFRLESGGTFSVSGTRPSSITFKIDGLTNPTRASARRRSRRRSTAFRSSRFRTTRIRRACGHWTGQRGHQGRRPTLLRLRVSSSEERGPAADQPSAQPQDAAPLQSVRGTLGGPSGRPSRRFSSYQGAVTTP
jgi:hypothetical protein